MVENRQSWIAWQTVKEVNGKKSTSREKLKAACLEEKLKGKEHFKNMHGNLTEVTDKPIKKINDKQQDIKLGQFRGRT